MLILKQSRFVPAFSALLKKVPTFHKNEFFQSVKTIELGRFLIYSGLKLLRIFSTTSSNRDYMISTNQLSTLNSCLSSFIGKEEKKLAIECLNVLFELLCSKIKGIDNLNQRTLSKLPILPSKSYFLASLSRS